MIRRILAYIAIVLLTLYCFFLYDHTIVTIMLLMEVIYFPVAVLCLIFLHRHIHFSLVSMPFIAEKNQKMMVRINVENDSRIPVVHFQMTLHIENAFTGDRIVYKKMVQLERVKRTKL